MGKFDQGLALQEFCPSPDVNGSFRTFQARIADLTAWLRRVSETMNDLVLPNTVPVLPLIPAVWVPATLRTLTKPEVIPPLV